MLSASLLHTFGIHCLPIFAKPSHFLLSDVISKRTTFSQPFPPPATRLPMCPDSSLRYRRHLLTYLLTYSRNYSLTTTMACYYCYCYCYYHYSCSWFPESKDLRLVERVLIGQMHFLPLNQMQQSTQTTSMLWPLFQDSLGKQAPERLN